MRRSLMVLVVVAFCTAPTWADSVELDVNAWATFSAPSSTCHSNCTERIDVSFLYQTPSIVNPLGALVPGTLDVIASGSLGSFSTLCTGCRFFGSSMGLFDLKGDEINLDFGGVKIRPGTDTLSFYMFSCLSQTCGSDYGQKWIGLDRFGEPSTQGSIVAAVAVPDETSFLSLGLTAFGTIGLAWCWRRRDAQKSKLA
ncbi:MAG: hypothetical protein WBV55_09815 [Candidatus Sulfotelmatobacter sp.]